MTKSRKKGKQEPPAFRKQTRKPPVPVIKENRPLFKSRRFMERHSHLSNLPPVPAQTFYGLHLPQGL